MEYAVAVIMLFMFFVLILVAISRWVFRINTIVAKLDAIVKLLTAANNSRVA